MGIDFSKIASAKADRTKEVLDSVALKKSWSKQGPGYWVELLKDRRGWYAQRRWSFKKDSELIEGASPGNPLSKDEAIRQFEGLIKGKLENEYIVAGRMQHEASPVKHLAFQMPDDSAGDDPLLNPEEPDWTRASKFDLDW